MLISFLFLHENIYCGYSLEAARRAASNEYPQHIFYRKVRKILCGYPLLSVAMSLYPDQTAPSESALFAYVILSDTLMYKSLGHLMYMYVDF